MRVLVVDDCVDNREMMAMLLGLWGHDARTAPDGPLALQAYQEFCPHVVLLDLAMPLMGGLEVARQLRELQGDRTLLLVAVSGWDRHDYDGCFDAHLTKPADPDALNALLISPGGPLRPGAVVVQ